MKTVIGAGMTIKNVTTSSKIIRLRLLTFGKIINLW
jgi:hypothetical protein